MTAHERFTTLLKSYPKIATDFDADGNPTDEAMARFGEWAWEHLTDSEKNEFEQHTRTKLADEVYDDLVRDGVIEEFIGPDGEGRIRFLDDPR